MTANRKSLAANKTRKDILRFAPNFTAYVLPPGVVCLYSEDRKFFLHGELYCAVAAAIGKNGKAAPKIVQQLSKSFPAEKIEEAINRLLERRYVVAGTSQAFDGAVAGYWASLGRRSRSRISAIVLCGSRRSMSKAPKNLPRA
jgi:hypothetical protein